jgi:hypothetical protein
MSQAERDDVEVEIAAVDAEFEKYIEDNSNLPGNFHAKYLTERARTKTHAARDKASKAQAAIADEQIKTAKKGNKRVTFGKSV